MRSGQGFVAGLILAAAVGAAFLLGDAGAQSTPTVVAHFAGAQSVKGAVPELVLFNTSAGAMTLDLRLYGPDGTLLIDRPGEIELAPRQTLFVSLGEQFARDLPRNVAPYRGTFSVAVSGPDPFGAGTVIAHVAQYFGARKRPRAAYLLQPVFRTE